MEPEARCGDERIVEKSGNEEDGLESVVRALQGRNQCVSCRF